MNQPVKAKYAKHYGPYLGIGFSFRAFGTGTHGGLEPDAVACRLLHHLSYAWTTLDFQERGLDGAGRDVNEYKRASAICRKDLTSHPYELHAPPYSHWSSTAAA